MDLASNEDTGGTGSFLLSLLTTFLQLFGQRLARLARFVHLFQWHLQTHNGLRLENGSSATHTITLSGQLTRLRLHVLGQMCFTYSPYQTAAVYTQSSKYSTTQSSGWTLQ